MHRKTSFYTGLGLFFIFLLVFFLLLFNYLLNRSKPEKAQKTPAKIEIPREALNFYAEKIKLHFYREDFAITLKAQKMYLAKGRIFGFHTRLFQKLIFIAPSISVYKNKDKILEIRKTRLEIDPKFNEIVIKDPETIFLKNKVKPLKIIIYPEKEKIIILTGRGKYEL